MNSAKLKWNLAGFCKCHEFPVRTEITIATAREPFDLQLFSER